MTSRSKEIAASRRGRLAGLFTSIAAAAGLTLICTCTTVRAAPVPFDPPTVHLTGPEGGPFPSGPTTIPLSNTTNQIIRWAATQTVHWALFSSLTGVLTAGGTGS